MPLNPEDGSPAEPVVVTLESLQAASVEHEPEPTPESPEPEAKAEEEGQEAEEKPGIPKGLQKRIDRLTREKHQMRAELETLRKAQEAASGASDTMAPTREQFASEEDYLDAVLDHREAVREAQKSAQSWSAKRDDILEKAEDSGVDLETFAELPVTRYMADAIVDSDYPVELVAYLTDNPAEVKRISALSGARQAAELGKIEAKLNGDEEKPKPAKTAAPAPIKPVAGSGKSSTGYRPEMSFSEYAKWRKANS